VAVYYAVVDNKHAKALAIFSTVILIAALYLPSSIWLYAFADSINPGLFSKASSPYGIPYKDWTAKWWQWLIGLPSASNPRINYNPSKCGVGQGGPVWFLTDVSGSGKEVRGCSIPAGKAILFPILSGECDYGVSTVKTDSDMRQCATEGNDFSVIAATVDGMKLKNLDQYRVQSDIFNITIPKDNIFDTSAGTFRAFVDGFFVFLQPLSPGNHIIHFSDSVINPVKPSLNNARDVTYDLIVK
jgi:hypothetical protein